MQSFWTFHFYVFLSGLRSRGLYWADQLATNILITCALIPVCAAWGLPIALAGIIATPLIGPCISWLLAWGCLLLIAACCGIGVSICCAVFEYSVSILYMALALPLPSWFLCSMPSLSLFSCLGIWTGTAIIAHARWLRRKRIRFWCACVLWLAFLIGLSHSLRRTEPLLYEKGATCLYIEPHADGLVIHDLSARCRTTQLTPWYMYTLRPFLIQTFGDARISTWQIHNHSKSVAKRAAYLYDQGRIMNKPQVF